MSVTREYIQARFKWLQSALFGGRIVHRPMLHAFTHSISVPLQINASFSAIINVALAFG